MTKIVIVGEAWGTQEKLMEHPFVGYSGRELAKMLHEAGVVTTPVPGEKPNAHEMIRFWTKAKQNDNIIVTNVFDYQPENNNIDLCFASPKDGGDTGLPAFKRGKYVRPELRYHVERLWAFIEAERPNLALALGNTACWALLGRTGITDLRGAITSATMLPSAPKVLPTFHPAAVTRQWNLRPIVVRDLEKAATEATTTTINRIERYITIEPTIEEIHEWISRPATFYAVDIENPSITVGTKKTYLKDQIAMVGFARSPTDALVIPFYDDNLPEGHFWSNPSDEAEALRCVDVLLKKPVPKIFQNGIYDLTHLLRQGFRPTMCHEDTMLLHHSLYPEMLKGLGFLGSIYSAEIAWKTMRGRGNNLKRDE